MYNFTASKLPSLADGMLRHGIGIVVLRIVEGDSD